MQGRTDKRAGKIIAYARTATMRKNRQDPNEKSKIIWTPRHAGLEGNQELTGWPEDT